MARRIEKTYMRDAKLRFLWADLETLRKRTGPRLVPLLILPGEQTE